jgi:membrane protease YdiL (CAAX protease family)
LDFAGGGGRLKRKGGGVSMNAAGVWAGLADSAFLAGINDRERDPRRLAVTVAAGACLGMAVAACGLLLILLAYAAIAGVAGHGFDVLAAVAPLIGGAPPASPGVTVLRLVAATGVDGVFMVVFVAFAAVVSGQPAKVYLTAAPHVRWRLLGLAIALSAAAIAPIVLTERLLSADGAPLPILTSDGLTYGLSSLLLIPAAAAEELFFRGWVMRQTAVFLRRPAALIAVTSLIFSALHRDFAPDAFLTRVLMGAGFAYMTLRLGGIELAVGAHAVNNLMIVLFLQPLDAQPSGGAAISGYSLIEYIALAGGYVLITEMVARLPRLRRLAGVKAEEISPSSITSARFKL